MSMMYPYTALITLLSVVLLQVLAVKVAAGRSKYEVKAPAITGHPDFERIFRVHYNSIENFILFIPALWLFAGQWGDVWAAAIGAIWVIGRVIYAAGYYQAPEKRGRGMMISSLAFYVLFLGALGGLIWHLLGM